MTLKGKTPIQEFRGFYEPNQTKQKNQLAYPLKRMLISPVYVLFIDSPDDTNFKLFSPFSV